eukprot:Gb_18401 [translate_table: standard]
MVVLNFMISSAVMCKSQMQNQVSQFSMPNITEVVNLLHNQDTRRRGSVPIKTPAALALDPFVFQSYKSFICFLTSWLVLLYTPFRFTWWGMLGALIWVTNGVGAIAAVRWAGIGVVQSLWSGLSSMFGL